MTTFAKNFLLKAGQALTEKLLFSQTLLNFHYFFHLIFPITYFFRILTPALKNDMSIDTHSFSFKGL